VKAQSKADVQATLKRLCDDGALAATMKVPDAAGALLLEVDLRAGRFTTGVEVDAPKDKQRAAASTNWFLKQLDRNVAGQVVEVSFAGTRETTAMKLEDIESGNALVSPTDKTRLPRRFTVKVSRKMGPKRSGSKGFITEAERQVVDFYRDSCRAYGRRSCARRSCPSRQRPKAHRRRRRQRQATAQPSTRSR
jgi:hypothetical protein